MQIPEAVLSGAVPAAEQAAQVWSQQAASFASIMQGSNISDAEQIQTFMGQVSQEAFLLIGREDELREMINGLLAKL